MIRRIRGRNVRPNQSIPRRIDDEENPEMGLVQKALQRQGFLDSEHNTNKWDEKTQWAWEEACSHHADSRHLIGTRPGKVNAPTWLAEEIAVIEEVKPEEVIVEVPIVTTSNPDIVPMDPEVEQAEIDRAINQSSSSNFDYVPPVEEAPPEVIPEIPPIVDESEFEVPDNEAVEDAFTAEPRVDLQLPASMDGENSDSNSLIEDDEPSINFDAPEPEISTESIGKPDITN